MKSAIEVEGVSRRFRLYHERYGSLKERALHFGRIPFDDFWALTDVSFTVAPGDTFGLLGHNGSGKSTLLKCIAGILRPTKGEVRTRGRVAALLELGAGFHPDLTGRENVFLNASLLGMSTRDIEGRFDDIVAFSELEPFIDNQVKYYSSGMYVRLGFAVAVNMDPEILIVDEVLAVGDELFQRKCLDRVRQFQRDGRTILVVTHSADMVRQICTSAAVLDQGHLVGLGEPGEVIRTFREHLLRRQAYVEATQFGVITDSDTPDGRHIDRSGTTSPITATESEGQEASAIRIKSFRVEYPSDGTRSCLYPGEPLIFHLEYETSRPVEDVVPGIAVYDDEGKMLFAANTLWFPVVHDVLNGTGEFIFAFASVPLLDGTYSITVALTTADEGTVYDWHEQHYSFQVMNPTPVAGLLYLPTKISVRPSQGEDYERFPTAPSMDT